MRTLEIIQQLIYFDGNILVCAGPTGFLEKFLCANLVSGIAINFSNVINPDKQRISEKRRPGK